MNKGDWLDTAWGPFAYAAIAVMLTAIEVGFIALMLSVSPWFAIGTALWLIILIGLSIRFYTSKTDAV